MRLIDADGLKEMICNNVYPVQDAFNTQDYGMFWTGGIEKAIDESPTIDAEPVRHGKWEVHEAFGYMDMTCSVCGWLYEYNFGLEREYKFCPHCGARMDEEVTDNE